MTAMKKLILTMLCIAACLTCPAQVPGATANQSEGFVTLTDVDNRAIEAKILDYRNGVVTVRTRNGTDSKISEARLKPESLAKVKHELSKKVMVRLRLDANPKLESKTKHFNSSGYRTATTTKVQNKKRSKNFEVTLDTTSPYEREVIVRWVITQGGEIFMGTERGVVGNKKVFEFGVDAVAASKTTRTETSVRTGPYWCGSWSSWATYVNEEIEGNDRLEMSVFVYDTDKKLLEAKTTLKVFDEFVRQKMMDKVENF